MQCLIHGICGCLYLLTRCDDAVTGWSPGHDALVRRLFLRFFSILLRVGTYKRYKRMSRVTYGKVRLAC